MHGCMLPSLSAGISGKPATLEHGIHLRPVAAVADSQPPLSVVPGRLEMSWPRRAVMYSPARLIAYSAACSARRARFSLLVVRRSTYATCAENSATTTRMDSTINATMSVVAPRWARGTDGVTGTDMRDLACVWAFK